MQLAVVIGAIVIFGCAATILFTIRYLARPRVKLPAELASRRAGLRARLARALERVPASASIVARDLPAVPGAAAVEARLLAGDARGALAEAEAALAAHSAEPRTRVLLARALLY